VNGHRAKPVRRLSLSEIYAVAAALLLLLLAIVNDPWLMLVVSTAGLAAGLIISRQPATEGQEGMLGSLRRAAVFGVLGFAVAIVFAIIVLIRG
jgi:hypothetical protein